VTAGGAGAAFELGPADPVMGSKLRIALPTAAAAVRICYRTSPRSTALQWCAPEQTADGTHPFLYSQCQTIHARSMLPIQDTPAVRFSYDATLQVPAGRFLGFLRDFLSAFRFRSVTGEQVVAFARERLPGAVDYDEWLHGTGLPAGAPAVASPLLDAVRAVGQAAPGPAVAAAWSADEWQVYLAGLRPPVPAGLLAELDGRYHLTASANPEILRLWLTAALRSGYPAAVPAAVDLLGRVGRLKFLKPLYDALASNPDTRGLARECFERNRRRYHPIAVAVIGARLGQAAGGGGRSGRDG
jgi:hypothetical protein